MVRIRVLLLHENPHSKLMTQHALATQARDIEAVGCAMSAHALRLAASGTPNVILVGSALSGGSPHPFPRVMKQNNPHA